MLVIISPSKTQDFSKTTLATHTLPAQQKQTAVLAEILKKQNCQQLKQLMSISDKLAQLNQQRFQDFNLDFTPDNAKQALLAFKGDVYQGFALSDYSAQDFKFAQAHLRIISGFYGMLRPLDLIKAYRLEMATKLPTKQGANLYQFWHETITDLLNKDEQSHIINLASGEYAKAIQHKKLTAKMVTIDFKENRQGSYKTIGLFAKRARGVMANYIIKNRLQDIEAIKAFSLNQYTYNPTLSTEDKWVFSR